MKNKKEGFCKLYGLYGVCGPLGPPDKVTRHVRLNNKGGVEYVSTKPPYTRGEYSCYHTVCPAVYEKDTICWRCDELTVDPQPKDDYDNLYKS